MTLTHIRRFIAATLLVTRVLFAQERFDQLVRQDFFAGFAGNQEAFDRAMKVTEALRSFSGDFAEFCRLWLNGDRRSKYYPGLALAHAIVPPLEGGGHRPGGRIERRSSIHHRFAGFET
jgi:hypothetical protein